MAKGSALRKQSNDAASAEFAALLEESLGGSASFEGTVVKGRVVRIANDFGAPVGAVVVRFDRTAIDAAIEQLRFDILNNAMPAGLGAVAAGSLACLLLLTRLQRRAHRSVRGQSRDDTISRAATELKQFDLDART